MGVVYKLSLSSILKQCETHLANPEQLLKDLSLGDLNLIGEYVTIMVELIRDQNGGVSCQLMFHIIISN